MARKIIQSKRITKGFMPGVGEKLLTDKQLWRVREDLWKKRIASLGLDKTTTKQWAAGGQISNGTKPDPKAVQQYLKAIERRDGVKPSKK